METFETLFNRLDDSINTLKDQEELTYLDALVHTLNLTLLEEEEKNDFSGENRAFIEQLQQMGLREADKETVRKVIQFAVLKSFKGATYDKYMITPDMVGFYVSYLVEKLMTSKEAIRLFDPVVGTANMLTAVMNQLSKPVQAYGAEVDETMLDLSLLSADMQQHRIEFFHQDSIQPLLLDPVDVVIADLPIGYYPDDERAKDFKVQAKEGHTYAHHLLIEQSLTYLKPEGFMIAVVPNHLFNSEQAPNLHKMIQEHAHVVGLLELPEESFKAKDQQKSLFILQKKGEETKAPKEALMVKLPSFKDLQKTENIIMKMNAWFDHYQK
ncbi:MAG: class I SAM-dependent methyltransferase [Bacillota bacterium]